MSEKIVLTIDDLTVAYQNTAVLWKVNAEIPTGSLVAVVGPNGAGKSTLIKTIMGIVPKNFGTVRIFGKELNQIKKRHEKISYMPQRGSVDWSFPLTCLDVVLMGRYGHIGWLRRPSEEDRKLAMEALDKFGMTDFYDRQIDELSGGQKQRVFLARSYLQDADLIFLDEPFGGIDARTEEVILDLLKELRDQGKTIVVVTHDLSSLQGHFDYAWLLNIHTIAFGRPDEILTPDNLAHCYGGTIHSYQEGSS